jgi:uncharacterized membrane protein HdeD (DUF308 family)
MSDHTVRPTEEYVVPAGFNRLADHWGLVLTYGLVTLGLGIVLLVWPDATVTVFAVILAIQLIVAGIFRIISALAMSSLEGGIRALIGLSGGLALIVGLLALREPLQTIVVLTLILGAWWVVAGVIDIIGAFLSPGSVRRAWDILSGLVSILAGGFLLVYTEFSLRALMVFVAIWLIVGGLIAVVASFRLRTARTASS